MFLKTPPSSAAIALLATSNQPLIASAITTSKASTLSRCCLHSPTYQHHHGVVRQRRCATTSSSSSSSSSGPRSSSNDDTPPAWPSTSHPTPYDIFSMPRKGPYTKKRFYQLVKLYHPDIHSSHYEAAMHTTANSHTTKPRNSSSSSSSSNGITHSIRLERYRLVIKANDILSNPEKRHLYDQYGIGWTERSQNEQLRAADRSWRDQPGNAAMNATWEDWEKWHAARDPSQKQPPGGFYMPNSVFAALVAMLCTIGALAQGRRAEVTGAHYVDVATQRHQDVSEEVRRSTSASAGMSQDERVERFLRDRENVIYSFSPGQYDSAEHTKPTR